MTLLHSNFVLLKTQFICADQYKVTNMHLHISHLIPKSSIAIRIKAAHLALMNCTAGQFTHILSRPDIALQISLFRY